MGRMRSESLLGENSGTQIGLHGSRASPIQPPAKLTPPQVTKLEASQWRFNIHIHKNPSGEIRGQVIGH